VKNIGKSPKYDSATAQEHSRPIRFKSKAGI